MSVSDPDSQLRKLYYLLLILGFLYWVSKSSLCCLFWPHKCIWLCPLQAPACLFIFTQPSPSFLVSSYLQGHTQQVAINDSLSSKSQVTSGVPQGSILSPLLFIIYINDLAILLLISSATLTFMLITFFYFRKFLLQLQCLYCSIINPITCDKLSSSHHQLQKIKYMIISRKSHSFSATSLLFS